MYIPAGTTMGNPRACICRTFGYLRYQLHLNLTNFTPNHGPGSMDSVEKAGSQATHTQSLAHETMQVTGNVAGCSHAVLGLPRQMSAVNTNGARAASAVP